MFVLIYMIFVIAIDNNISDILFLILFMILFCFFIDNLCWQLNGKEIVSFEKNGISIKKKGRLLNSRKFIFMKILTMSFMKK